MGARNLLYGGRTTITFSLALTFLPWCTSMYYYVLYLLLLSTVVSMFALG